jgi:hypothetical protein
MIGVVGKREELKSSTIGLPTQVVNNGTRAIQDCGAVLDASAASILG